MGRKTRGLIHGNADAPRISATAAVSPSNARFSDDIPATQRQWELFRTSGPQAPKKERKRERKEAYRQWVEDEPKRELARDRKRAEERAARGQARAARVAKALAKKEARLLMSESGYRGPNRPEPQPRRYTEPPERNHTDPTPIPAPGTAPPPAERRVERRRGIGIRSWLKKRLGL
ncbi:hypothetical protein BGZ63DRAFT_400550 [Mariannaea sp. PMI_226]|nr:hypothetical protein BGZ63DRAFT_400550 [Mariannaea sp. PMI_226]